MNTECVSATHDSSGAANAAEVKPSFKLAQNLPCGPRTRTIHGLRFDFEPDGSIYIFRGSVIIGQIFPMVGGRWSAAFTGKIVASSVERGTAAAALIFWLEAEAAS